MLGAGLAAALAFAALMLGRNDSAALQARMAKLEQQLQGLATRPQAAGDPSALDEVRGRLAKLEAAALTPRPAPPDEAVANRIAAIEGEVKVVHEQIGVAQRRSDEAVATAREARARVDATAATVSELAQKLDRPGPPPAQKSELDALAARVASLESASKAVQNELAKRAAEGNDRTGRLAVAASALNAAVERGAPFAAELATVKGLAPDPKALAPLEAFAATGVPTTTALARELAGLEPALHEAVGASARERGFLERLQENAEKIIRIRRVGETSGNDPAAILARVEFKAMHGDVNGALADLTTLPAPVRAPAEAWINKVQARTAAIEASRRLVADALAGLSK